MIKGIMRSFDPVTRTLIALNIVSYGYNIYKNGWDAVTGLSPGEALAAGAMGPHADAGALSFLTSMFSHTSLSHLGVNMLMLLFLGRIASRSFGSGAYLTAFLGSAAAGNIATYISMPDAVSMGASGGVFGVIGMLTAGAFLKPAMRELRGVILLLGGTALLATWLMPQINIPSHIAGLASGLVTAAALSYFRR